MLELGGLGMDGDLRLGCQRRMRGAFWILEVGTVLSLAPTGCPADTPPRQPDTPPASHSHPPGVSLTPLIEGIHSEENTLKEDGRCAWTRRRHDDKTARRDHLRSRVARHRRIGLTNRQLGVAEARRAGPANGTAAGF